MAVWPDGTVDVVGTGCGTAGRRSCTLVHRRRRELSLTGHGRCLDTFGEWVVRETVGLPRGPPSPNQTFVSVAGTASGGRASQGWRSEPCR